MIESVLSEFGRVDGVIRQRIVRGNYPPGQRLPNYVELGREFGVGQSTIRQAMARLGSDGFVRTRRRSGTFVADAPPHISTLALVLPWEMSLFYQALLSASQLITTGTEQGASPAGVRWRFREYALPTSQRDLHDWPKLTDDVISHRVGGIVFTQPPLTMEHTSVATERGIPRVVIASRPVGGYPCVYPDESSFARLAVKHLLACGRRRIAHLRFDSVHTDPDAEDRFIASLGAEVRPTWLQWVPCGPTTRGAAGIVRLLMKLSVNDRPDALVIHDDNLIEPVVAGLMSAGTRVPEELEVVAYANFPCPRATQQLPFTLIGQDCVEIMRLCVGAIDMQRRGEQPSPRTSIPAVFAGQTAHSSLNSNLSAEALK